MFIYAVKTEPKKKTLGKKTKKNTETEISKQQHRDYEEKWSLDDESLRRRHDQQKQNVKKRMKNKHSCHIRIKIRLHVKIGENFREQ